jgi:hypothetical protein
MSRISTYDEKLGMVKAHDTPAQGSRFKIRKKRVLSGCPS